MKKVKSLVITGIILFILLLLSYSNATSNIPITDKSLDADTSGKVFGVKLTDGNSFIDINGDVKERERVNNSILNNENNSSSPISLYSRFGPDIKFVGYYGEANYNIEIKDRIYTFISEDRINEFKFDDLFYKSDRFLKTDVYKGRAPVLTKGEVNNGAIDPRVSHHSNISFTRRI